MAATAATPACGTALARHGILLFAHGSRDPLWRAPLEAVAAHIAQQSPHRPVACAYLELCVPTLADAAQAMIAQQGVRRITITPLFLGTGKHARHDLPELVQALRAAHPQVQFDVQAAVGEDPRMTALMAQIACEAVNP